MEARQMKLLDLLSEPSVRFCIPLFQRSYAWDQMQCEDLVIDALRAARANTQHFASTVLYCPTACIDGGEGCGCGAGEGEAALAAGAAAPAAFHVVDGQQRLTTLTLLLLALRKHMREHDLRLPGMGAEDLTATFLVLEGAPKLDLSVQDRATLAALVLDQPLPQRPSERVVANYDYFCGLCEQPDFDLDLMWTGLRSLFCIAVQLDHQDCPQQVFESFNARGVGLVTADMVRNFLLSNRSYADQRRLYHEFWEPMAALFGDDPGSIKLNNAILGWLAVRSPKNRAHCDKQAFRVFRQFFERQYQGEVEQLLAELGNFCMVWAENYRYHAVKAFRSADWAVIGKKTLVSDRPKAQANPQAVEYYAKHFGVNVAW